jgi:tripartite ATP-independent transporter DctM subunit
MAAVALPEMKKYHYDMELASGAVAAGGSLGMLIPPSVVFIVYAIMTQQSVGALFVAGIVPGLMIALIFCLTIYIICKRRPEQGPACANPGWRERFVSLIGVGETLILFMIVIGGLFGGIFTPTEAAAIGSAGSFVIALFKRKLNLTMIRKSLFETLRTSCMVMTIVAGAVIFGRFLAITQIPMTLATWLAQLPIAGWMIIALIIFFYLLAGCFVDALALVLLTVPIFAPVVTGLGYDLVWFGVIMVVVTQMGVISPPVGVCAYIVCGTARDVPLQTVFKGCIPFLIALVISAVILVAFPSISLFLGQWLQQG